MGMSTDILEEKSIELLEMLIKEEKVKITSDPIYGRLSEDVLDSVEYILDNYIKLQVEYEVIKDNYDEMKNHVNRIENKLQKLSREEIVRWEDVENNL